MKTQSCNTTTEFNLGHCFDRAKAQVGTDDAMLLATQLLGVSFTELYTERGRRLSLADVEKLKSAVQRRLCGEPIAYITGYRMFRSLDLRVSADVLIPRFETELLVDVVIELTSNRGRVLDLGTGSGAIAIALSKTKELQVVAVDNDERTLQVCAENCREHEAKVELVCSNWFENVRGRFDTIVSNPPYIAADDPHLEEGDLRFEPPAALVGGRSGLEHLEEIITSSMNFLNPGGWLVVEHGYDQQASVKKLFADRGYLDIQHRCDYTDTPRVMWGRSRGR
ncbi:MAG: peptide chain release factor N(5)-glutamine methyltransferase [Gammaproteobacteria bacterium]|nr:peptide chain release factor N(5)-glutamine methyltransferase [Gammaproteobacteria bacterium]MYC25632.1 peptide chain release factor N(5)-glutamine methyltransferase [Gammaproteobacteria bacterium]